MKKAVMVIIAAAVFSPAQAEEFKLNFEAGVIPIPVIEEVSVPARRVDMDKMSDEEVGGMLLKAAKLNSRAPEESCRAGEPIAAGNRVCASKCCAIDPKGDGRYELPGCVPLEPCFKAENPEEKAVARARILLAETLKNSGDAKKNRGKYEDCCNSVNDAYLDCVKKNPLDPNGSCIKAQQCGIVVCGGGVCTD